EVDRKRFNAEASAAIRLDHPNIVPIYEIGEHNGRPFFCMKLIEGETLAQRLTRGPVPARRSAQILSDISDAIGYAHDNGVLHRDMKPSNILIDADGVPYVADFGLAKYEPGRQMSLTRSGAVIGTPSYMAPEQAAGTRGEISQASDVYSLGAILYHMLTGRPPFMAATPVDTVLMVLEQDPIAPRILNRRVNRSLEMIAMRCLQKPRDLRYVSAAALADDLRAFLSNQPVSAREGRLGQVVTNLFRETHHAAVLENWGLLWMWHSLVLLVTCVLTNVMYKFIPDNPWPYVLVWTLGFGAWVGVFWFMRRQMGPVTFVERQIAHVWAASLFCVVLLFPIEKLLGMGVLDLAPVLGLVAGGTFLIKAGILSGSFYIQAAILFLTSFAMAMFPGYAMSIFGVVSAACFFFSGLKYYRRKILQSESG
ncbi:MAG: serine/threonine-protein kinase, partial [Planctomycetota bacterium]